MKASTFENLIRKVVREEIDYSLRREIKSLKEDLRNETKPTIVEQTKRQIKDHTLPLKEKILTNVPLKKPSKPVPFTSNSTLNDLLNETAMGNTNTESGNSVSEKKNWKILYRKIPNQTIMYRKIRIR